MFEKNSTKYLGHDMFYIYIITIFRTQCLMNIDIA